MQTVVYRPLQFSFPLLALLQAISFTVHLHLNTTCWLCNFRHYLFISLSLRTPFSVLSRFERYKSPFSTFRHIWPTSASQRLCSQGCLSSVWSTFFLLSLYHCHPRISLYYCPRVSFVLESLFTGLAYCCFFGVLPHSVGSYPPVAFLSRDAWKRKFQTLSVWKSL